MYLNANGLLLIVYDWFILWGYVELLLVIVPEVLYDSMSDLGEIRVYQRADFQSGSRVLKKVF